ncbi:MULTISPECIES: metallophosphoesterase family protein [Streptomyces]|nr:MULTISPECIES: metallophosphoesterase family protein [Streptomyces]MCX4614944.1 metallophosphatase family protein [Streptomyces mirabilis]
MDTTLYGPRAWEGPTRRYGPMRRVAVVSDVHANVPALTAVLAEIEGAGVDLVVSCGDLTWGAEPDRTVELMAGLPWALFVRGNGERAVVDIHRGVRRPSTEREAWVPRQHSDASVAFVAGIPFSVVVDVVGLGPVRFCHGSPRGDTELVTPATPAGRFAELAADVEEAVIVTGHTHLQFDRTVAGRRSVNPGSVGLPFHEGPPGTAFWALLGPDVELRQTSYDVDAARAAGPRTGDPAAERITALLNSPPTPAEITSDAEARVFSD